MSALSSTFDCCNHKEAKWSFWSKNVITDSFVSVVFPINTRLIFPQSRLNNHFSNLFTFFTLFGFGGFLEKPLWRPNPSARSHMPKRSSGPTPPRSHSHLCSHCYEFFHPLLFVFEVCVFSFFIWHNHWRYALFL